MFATLAGGYPFGPLPGAVGGFAAARRAWARGELDADGFARACDAHVSTIAAEQATAGLDLVEDALAGYPGDGIEGLAAALISGDVAPESVVAAWRRVDAATDLPTKAVVPGPIALAAVRRRSGARADPDRDVALVGASLGALADAGCAMAFVVEAPLVGVGPDVHAWHSVAAAHEAALRDVAARLHVCLSIPGGAPDPTGIPALTAGPYASHHVAVTAGPDAWRYLGALPPDRGVIVGAGRADTDALDDEEVLVWAATLAAECEGRGPARVGLAPSGSLADLDRHRARRKIERLGGALQLLRMGPPSEVARALQADPGTAPIAALRRLIADHDAVLPPIDRPRSPT